MKQLKKAALVVCLLSFSFMTATASEEVREAFDSGINSAIKVMKYERAQANKPITKGYCIAVEGEEGNRMNSFTAIKLESLSLYKKYPNPMYLEFIDQDSRNSQVLCIAFIDSEGGEAKVLLKKIRRDYPKIERYYPHIVRIANPKSYRHIIPGIGKWNEDSTETIKTLSGNLATTERKKIEEIKRLNGIIAEQKQLISSITGKIRAIIDPSSLTKAPKKTKPKETEKKLGKEKNKEFEDGPKKVDKKVVEKKVSKKKPKKKTLTLAKKGKHPILEQHSNLKRFEDKKEGIIIKKIDPDSKRVLVIEQ